MTREELKAQVRTAIESGMHLTWESDENNVSYQYRVEIDVDQSLEAVMKVMDSLYKQLSGEIN